MEIKSDRNCLENSAIALYKPDSTKDLNMQSIAKVAVLPKEYVVILHTIDTDENGAPWGRAINVVWDAGVVPDWDEWLKFYTEGEEPYKINEIIELDPNHVNEM